MLFPLRFDSNDKAVAIRDTSAGPKDKAMATRDTSKGSNISDNTTSVSKEMLVTDSHYLYVKRKLTYHLNDTNVIMAMK